MKTFCDADQRQWQAEIISHGQTSGYLNERVHQPVLQFTCLDTTGPRRYVGYPLDDNALNNLSEPQLRELLGRASAH